jgi:hypothetical protein
LALLFFFSLIICVLWSRHTIITFILLGRGPAINYKKTLLRGFIKNLTTSF